MLINFVVVVVFFNIYIFTPFLAICTFFAGPILNKVNLNASFYQTCTYTTQIYMSN